MITHPRGVRERAPRFLPSVHTALNHEILPARRFVKTLGSWWQFGAAHGARLLDPVRPQPLHAREVKCVGARDGAGEGLQEGLQTNGLSSSPPHRPDFSTPTARRALLGSHTLQLMSHFPEWAVAGPGDLNECFGHTVMHVGEELESPILDDLLSLVNRVSSKSYHYRAGFKAGRKCLSRSATRAGG